MRIRDWSSDVCSSDLKNYDPRATVMQKTVREVFDALKVNDPVFEVALQLEEMALNDPYFIEKKLFPNVDFYSGVILSAIGFPTTMFTALFALARTVGWVAQRSEEHTSELQSLMRNSYAVFCLKKKNIDVQQNSKN